MKNDENNKNGENSKTSESTKSAEAEEGFINVVKGLISGSIKTVCVPVHNAGWPFIAIFALISLFSSLIWEGFGLIGLVLTLWCIYFFRDPDRTTPTKEGLIISPADGVVSAISKVALPAEIDPDLDKDDPLFKAKTLTRVSVFLNVFNVHVNRVPIDGEVTQVIYHAGKFLNATLDKASDENERCTVVMKTKDKKTSVAFVQIAGLIARRILCDAKTGMNYKSGERYGIIRFGSRMDIYLPPRVMPLVAVGQTMIGGETVIADMESSESAREGEIRG